MPRGNVRLHLAKAIKPNRGPVVVTLGDARFFMEMLLNDEQRKDSAWEYASAVINKAVSTGIRADIEEATRAFEVALRKEGWLK